MVQQMFLLVYSKKTLIRVAFAVLSLAGVAQAHAASIPQSGGYNYVAGGGG
jgi:hypothetical protein